MQRHDRQILEKLKEVSYFSTYADNTEVISQIADLCSVRHFKSGKTIIREGEHGDELFIILNGEIDIVKRTLQDEEYTVTTLSSEMGGINVGELALIDNDQRSATVIAKTDCECLVITRRDFIKFGDEHPQIGLTITRAIASQLSTRLRKTNSDVITLFSALVEEISEED